MDTLEIVIYISTAVLIAGAVLLVVAKTTNIDLYGKIQDMINDDSPEAFQKVDNQTIGPLLFRTWEECGLGSVPMNVTFQLESPREFNKTDLFQYVKRMRLCRTLSSVQEDCGTREDVLMPTLQPGTIYVVECQPGSIGGKLLIS